MATRQWPTNTRWYSTSTSLNDTLQMRMKLQTSIIILLLLSIPTFAQRKADKPNKLNPDIQKMVR